MVSSVAQWQSPALSDVDRDPCLSSLLFPVFRLQKPHVAPNRLCFVDNYLPSIVADLITLTRHRPFPLLLLLYNRSDGRALAV